MLTLIPDVGLRMYSTSKAPPIIKYFLFPSNKSFIITSYGTVGGDPGNGNIPHTIAKAMLITAYIMSSINESIVFGMVVTKVTTLFTNVEKTLVGGLPNTSSSTSASIANRDAMIRKFTRILIPEDIMSL